MDKMSSQAPSAPRVVIACRVMEPEFAALMPEGEADRHLADANVGTDDDGAGSVIDDHPGDAVGIDWLVFDGGDRADQVALAADLYFDCPGILHLG